MKSVSVIIPLFNKEAYVADCLASLCAQTHKPQEVIIVDDGSSDASLDIVYSARNSFEEADIALHIIENKHAGVSHALNTGLALAQGTFVTRVDADDVVSPLWLETLLSCVKTIKPISVRCTHKRIASSYRVSSNVSKPDSAEAHQQDMLASRGRSCDGASLLQKSGNELYHQLFAAIDTNLMSACGTLYVREDLTREGIKFDETLTHTEDLLFNALYFAHGNPAILAPEPLYYYRQVKDSLSHKTSNLFETITKLDGALTQLATNAATQEIASDNEAAMLGYLCCYYTIAMLDLEQITNAQEFSSTIEHAFVSSSIESVFKRAQKLHAVSQTALRLYDFAAKKQYAQLRLAARTINFGRSIRRVIKAL